MSQLEMSPNFVTSVSKQNCHTEAACGLILPKMSGFCSVDCLLLDLLLCGFSDVQVFCFLPLLQSQIRWGMHQRVLDGTGLH